MVKIHLIGLFFNNFLPTAVGGDFARVFYLGRETGYGTATTSVLLDRLFGFFWTATWAVALCWLLPVSGANMVAGRHAIVIAALVLAACTGAVFFFPLGKLEDFIRRVSQDRLAGAAEGLANRLRLLRSRPKAFVGLGGIVLTYYFILAALYQEYFAMFRRSSPELVSILAVLFSIGLLANIPVSLNGIGLREQLHVILFGMLGIKKEIALGISLMMLLGLLLWSLVGCALWLQRRARPNNMRDASTRSRSMPPPRRPRPDERAE